MDFSDELERRQTRGILKSAYRLPVSVRVRTTALTSLTIQTGNRKHKPLSPFFFCLSADDEHSWPFLSHRRKTLYHHVGPSVRIYPLFYSHFLFSSSSSSCSSIGWNLLCKPLPLHRLRQLIGQLLHHHLKDIRECFFLVSHLRDALCSPTTCNLQPAQKTPGDPSNCDCVFK